MKQDDDLDAVVRQRIRGLRLARGWSLDELAGRCFLSPSTLSRLETGSRRIALDQLVAIAKALGTSLDQLVESIDDDDIVIRPQQDKIRDVTTWSLSRDRGANGASVTKARFGRRLRSNPELRVHPGGAWFTVLSGTARLHLGDRTILVQAGEAAEFNTMIPHAFGAHDGPLEILGIFDRAGELAYLHPSPV
jgi:transcriptional regulator with XRE-family HTH domain